MVGIIHELSQRWKDADDKIRPAVAPRRSIRLKEYDYSQPGAYFVTLVAFQREAVLGEIIDGEVKLYAAGKIVRSIWEDLPRRYPGLELDEMIVMPNHFHGILNITEDTVGAIHELPQLREETPKEYRIRRLPKIIGYLKMNSARKINLLRDSTNIPVWQKNYFERVIRNDEELNRVREYIRYNPVKWEEDEEYIFR